MSRGIFDTAAPCPPEQVVHWKSVSVNRSGYQLDTASGKSIESVVVAADLTLTAEGLAVLSVELSFASNI